jgi:branched-chain amino acid transport system permease protein
LKSGLILNIIVEEYERLNSWCLVEHGMVELSTVVQILFWGVASGCIYVLLATGLNIVFGVMKLVNFAHGQLLMIGAYVGFATSVSFGLNPYVSIVVAMAIVALVGVGVERFAFRRVLGADKLNEIFVSLGLIYIFENAVVLLWGNGTRRMVSPFASQSIALGAGVSLSYDRLAVVIIVAATLIGLAFLMKKTKIGLAMRATSQKSETAKLMGINIKRIYVFSFALGAALAAAAGVLYGIIFSFDPYIGALPTIKAFAIIILGGLGSIPGAIVGGLLYGVAEQSATFFLGGIWQDAVAFAVLIIVLVIRPNGIFGEKGE